MAYGQNMDAPMSGLMGLAAMKGRQGDNTLVHVNPMELKALNAMAPGGLTTNPVTGLPEAFKLKDLLPALGAIAGAAFLPMMIPALAGGSALAAAGAAGLGGAAGTALAGGNKEEIIGSGLMSGATAGLGSYLGGAGKTVGGLEDAAFDKTLAAQGITDGGVTATQAQLDLANTAANQAGNKAILAGVPTQAEVAGRTTLQQAAANVGGFGGATTTGLAAMAPMMAPEQPAEIQYGPIQEIQTQQTQQSSKEDIDKYIRQGGAMPDFFKFNVTQPGVYRAEGGPVSQGEMFSGMVEGNGDGMSDGIPFDVVGDPEIDRAMLSPDEYVMDAYTVAALGNGSSDAGAEKLDQFRKELREKVYGKKQQPNQINPNKELSKLS